MNATPKQRNITFEELLRPPPLTDDEIDIVLREMGSEGDLP
ncbi:hypothetical protein [Streptomyces sp. NPDC046909]